MAYVPREQPADRELKFFAIRILIIVAFAVGLALLWAVRDVLILIAIAAVLAAGIAPAVQRVRIIGRHWFHRNIPRGTAVLIVYFPFLFLVIILLVVMVPRLIDDTRALSAQLPAMIEHNVLTPLEKYVPMRAIREYLRGGIALPKASVFLYVRSAATAIASFVAVLFMVVYMLIDAHRLRNLFLLLYPPEVRAERRRTVTRMGRRMSSWLAGQLLLSAMMGGAIFVLMIALRLPYALPLALFATLGEMVPVIGPILGTAPALAIAILHSPWQFWSLLAAAIVLQKLENLIVAPRVMSRKVNISPLAAFIAFMMGAALLGIVGAIIAIPTAAIIQVAFEEMFVQHRERRHDLERAGTLLKRVD
ncbi:MAG: AI-2E family transporter [Acidobacteriota bacterium]